MKTSEVLNRAADLIEERGWSMGTGWDDDGASPLCVEGAIAAAMGQRSGVGFRCAAYDAVRGYIGNKPLFQWNDHAPWQGNHWSNPLLVPHDLDASVELARVSVIIATLRAAALIEAAKENQSVAVEAVS